jgi:folate-binding protein YgfZ
MLSRDQYEALRTGAGMLDRSDRGRLRLTGADRRAYLHGLLTNDIASLARGDGCYAALLTPQGRMISDMRVLELGDSVLIDLPGFTAEVVRQRLADFIFSEDVEVLDVQRSQSQLGLYGPRAAVILAELLTPTDGSEALDVRRQRLDRMTINANGQWSLAGEAVVVVRSDDYGTAGFDLFFDAGSSGTVSRAIEDTGATRVDPETVDVVRIESGRPEFGQDMDEHTIPLEAGIEDRAISLTKGCYVGQEIIIRVLHRGQGRVAKRLVGFVADPQAEELRPGDRLHAAGKDVGAVTSAAVSPRLGRPIGLGFVHRDHAEPGHVLDVGGSGSTRKVALVPLPFVQPDGEASGVSRSATG